MRTRRQAAVGLLLGLGLSVVAHLAFVPILVTPLISRQPEERWQRVEFMGMGRDIEFEEEEEPEPEYDPDVDIPDRQVVDAPEPVETVENEDPADWLSDKTVRVEKESKNVHRVSGEYELGASIEGPPGMQDGVESPGIVSEPMEMGQDFEPAEEGTVLMGDDAFEYEYDPDAPPVNLAPSFASMAAAVKGSGIDHLEGVEEGSETLLNSDEWMYAGFFNRVKKAVAQHWHPGPAYQLHDPTGRVYGYKDRETIVRIVLHCDGKLKHTYVKKPSGAGFLDDVAVKAIEKAAPFTNPPDALCDPEEKIIAFRFGFLVKVGDSSIIKVKKY